MTYDNTNRGALFKNQDKESEKHPDYKGTLNVDGKEFQIAAWIKESQKGQKYMSLSVSEPFKKGDKPAKQSAKPQDEDPEIPF
jgi:uncharacterized protein (DUF736 family)